MKLERLLSFVYNSPWCITESAFANIEKILSAKLAGANLDNFISPDDTDDQDDAPYTVAGSVAILAVEGVILPKCSGLDTLCGAYSLEDFKSNLQAIANDTQIKSVILNFDSPGGSVRGLPEATDAINALASVKPVYSYVGAGCVCASAAYWMASQSSGIFASTSAQTGSIGVFVKFIDQSKAFAMEGLQVEIFKAGDQKAMGIPGTSLSDADKATIQDNVNKTYAQFTSVINAKRPQVAKTTMQGLAYDTDDAVKLGLVDGQVNNLNALVAYLNAN